MLLHFISPFQCICRELSILCYIVFVCMLMSGLRLLDLNKETTYLLTYLHAGLQVSMCSSYDLCLPGWHREKDRQLLTSYTICWASWAKKNQELTARKMQRLVNLFGRTPIQRKATQNQTGPRLRYGCFRKPHVTRYEENGCLCLCKACTVRSTLKQRRAASVIAIASLIIRTQTVHIICLHTHDNRIPNAKILAMI